MDERPLHQSEIQDKLFSMWIASQSISRNAHDIIHNDAFLTSEDYKALREIVQLSNVLGGRIKSVTAYMQ